MPTRRQLIATAAVVGGGLVKSAQAAVSSPVQHLAERFAATLTAHDIDAFAALLSDHYINHQSSAAAPAPANLTAKQATVAFFHARLVGMPDLTVTIEQMVSNGARVAASFVYTGTHDGVFFGVPPTGRKLRFTSCDIFRVEHGLLAEHWGMGDIAGVMAQLHA